MAGGWWFPGRIQLPVGCGTDFRASTRTSDQTPDATGFTLRGQPARPPWTAQACRVIDAKSSASCQPSGGGKIRTKGVRYRPTGVAQAAPPPPCADPNPVAMHLATADEARQ